MTPLGSATIGTAWFLNGLANLQQQETQTQIELSSGYQINDAADSPSQTPELIQLGSTSRRGAGLPGKSEQRANGSQYGGSGDRVGGITLIQNAMTLATQGASSTASAATDQTLATDSPEYPAAACRDRQHHRRRARHLRRRPGSVPALSIRCRAARRASTASPLQTISRT